ncbi:COG4705 family protein [Leifsonia sp. RAF41]|uniref:COG4705 family protein n=1 Tax=Leifsonia sp. RAF41 TaxID=3233056 RepID=UPI003F956430
MRNTVPAVTALFWVTKLLTTAMGETASDYLVKTIDPVVAVGGAFLLFAAALVLQFAVRRYIPWVYWSAVLMVAVFGTMVADVLHVELGIPYLVSTVVLAVALAAVFVVWYATQRTLSVHRIDSRARQFFYWCAVLMTFALGTALGDLTAVTFGLGYFASALVFGILFAIPGIAYRWWGLGATAAFWSAYVLTRPFGASVSDGLAVSHARGGLALGTGPVSIALLAAIVVCVAVLSRRGGRTAGEPSAAASPAPSTSSAS